MRVHNVARRTLFDPMHDEQPFCHSLTERRRTTVKFLGQQSEMMIDDTWPQAGEMRSLWKGTTEFWTNDMPQDDTWEPNRHHSHILPLFRSHLTRDTAALPKFSVCTATTTMTPLMAQNLDDKGEITEAIKSFQRELACEEEERRSSQNMEEQSGQNKVIETALRQEQAMEKMSLITKLLEVKLEPAGQ